MDTDERSDASNREERAVDVGRGTLPGIVPNREALIRHAEDHLGADHVAGQPKRVNLRAAERRSACFARAGGLRDWHGYRWRAHAP